MTTTAQNELATDIQARPDGYVRVVLRGRLDAQTAVTFWNLLEHKLDATKIKVLEVDASGLQFCDGAGLALPRYLNMGKMTPSATVTVRGLEPDLEKLFLAFTSEDYEAFRSAARVKIHSLPEEVGESASHAAADLREQVAFLGDIVASLPQASHHAIGNECAGRKCAVFFELAGANAVPIVSLVSVLVGLVIAFESAQPLAQFGAQIYVVNMIGLVMVRELGPLLAAILLAGRSGSAFAAEIGTMKVNEEMKALETLGHDPILYQVVQRITAGVILTPLLTFYATFMGVLGGVLVTLILGFPLTLIFHHLTSSVQLSDVALGATKGVVFGAIVSAVGCLRGLQTQQGPSCRRCFHHSRGRDQHFADRHRGRSIFNPLLHFETMSDSPETIISVRNLKIGYGEKVILQNINFQVRRGEVFVILGGSGCGKSTLLKNLIGLYTPLAGEVWIEDGNLVAARDDERLKLLRKFGVMYQSGALFGSMTVLENVKLALDEFTALPEPVKELVALAKLKLVGLGAAAQKMPSELSGGMQKRAAIARAMALDSANPFSRMNLPPDLTR